MEVEDSQLESRPSTTSEPQSKPGGPCSSLSHAENTVLPQMQSVILDVQPFGVVAGYTSSKAVLQVAYADSRTYDCVLRFVHGWILLL